MEDEKLKAYFKFDEGDLQANRYGQFAEKQKARIISDEKSSRGFIRGLGGGLVLSA